jgi:hypothetical protein
MSSHVFISYSHADSTAAQRIHNALVRAQIPVFIDLIGLNPGDSLTSAIGAAIENAKAVVPIISRSSITSDWVKKELITCKELGITIIPFKADDAPWTAQLRLVLGDVLYIDGADFLYAEGLVPKSLTHLLPPTTHAREGHYFPVGTSGRNDPQVQCFFGTLGTAWDELRFGRTAIVLPTNQDVYLGGKVATSILEHLGILATSLTPARSPISSREVSLLTSQNGEPSNPVLIATTVFNSRGEPQAEDQWRSAGAILSCAEQQRCTLVLVPPLGTGAFDWPVRQAVVNWLYGAVGWYRSNATARSVWPVLCVPGPGDQKIMSYYLESLTRERLETLRDRKLNLRVRYQQELSNELRISHDVLLGSVAKSAFPNLKDVRLRFRHGARLIRRSSRTLFDYDGDTPLARTIFADGDIIEAYSGQ